jgi:hypothetical protein
VNKPFFIETYIWAVCDCMVLELHLCMLSVPIATKIASSFSLPRSILSIISVFIFGFLDNQHWLEQYNWYIIENSVEHPWTLNFIPWWWFLNTKPYMKVTLKDYLKIMKESTCHCLKYNNKIATINRDDSRYFKMDPLHRIRIYFLPNWEIL